MIEGLPKGSLRLRLTDDELTAYFAVLTVTDSWDVARATRSDRSAPFGPYERLSVNTTMYDFSPTFTDGELVLYIESRRPSVFHLFRYERAAMDEPFGDGEIQLVAGATDDPLNAEGGPYVMPDASALYFHANRGSQVGRLYRSQLIDGELRPAEDMMLRVSDRGEAFPLVTRDELAIYFTAYIDDHEDGDIFVATRQPGSDPTTGFADPVPLTAINGGANDVASWIAGDGCRLYFSRSITPFTGDSVAYVVERQPDL